MRNIISITRKELNSYFSSPVAYVIMTVFLVLFGYFFLFYLNEFSMINMQAMRSPKMQEQINVNQMVFSPAYGTTGIIFLFIAPLLTMRLFAEEKKSKTLELLMTSPVRISEMIIGKYLAALLLLSLMLFLSAYSVISLFVISTPDLGPMLSTYLGFFLMSGALISVGIFASSVTENQVIAAVISFGILLFFWVIGGMGQSGVSDVKAAVSFLSIVTHLENFLKGIIDTSDVVYYLSFIFFWLFATHRVLESQRWK